jgi:hypothetical protein
MEPENSNQTLFARSVKADFDPATRILHVAFTRRIRPGSEKQMAAHFAQFETLVEQYARDGRIYLIIDMTNLIFEPEFQAAYATQARKISDIYIYPKGIARYGYQITRITVRSSYDKYMNGSPNIFNSREEAFAYIHAMIEKSKETTPQMRIPSTVPGIDGIS